MNKQTNVWKISPLYRTLSPNGACLEAIQKAREASLRVRKQARGSERSAWGSGGQSDGLGGQPEGLGGQLEGLEDSLRAYEVKPRAWRTARVPGRSVRVSEGHPKSLEVKGDKRERKQGHRHKSRALVREIVKTCENL